MRASSGWPWLAAAAATIAAIAYLHAFVLHKMGTADDAFFSAALDHQGFFEYLRFRYFHWTGRIPIEAALVLLINHMALWRILNAAMLLLLCHCLGRIGFGDRLGAPARLAVVFVLLLLLPPQTLWQGAWWVTGSFNYLWPAALGAYACLPFFDRQIRSIPRLATHALAAGLAAYNEQIGFLLLCLLMPLWFAQDTNRRQRGWQATILLMLAANWLVGMTAPGVRHRYELEHRWVANFDALNFMDKANIGLGLAKQGLLDPANLLVLLLAVASVRPVLDSPAGRLAKAAILSGLAWIGAGALAALFAPASRFSAAYAVGAASGANAAYANVYLAMAIGLTAIACLVTAASLAFRRSVQGLSYAMWTMLAAIASIAALGWSPTAYASGDRVLFAAGLVFVVVCCRVLGTIRGWAFALLLGVSALGAIARFAHLVA